MKRLVLIGVVIASVLSAGISCAPNVEKEKAAIAAADKWLTLVDTGKYSESWQEAAGNFKSTVEQDQYVQILQSRQALLGKVISRKLETKVYKTSLPGAPGGQYVIIQYITSFQNKKYFIESVISMFDKDGLWRVLSYDCQILPPHYHMKMVMDFGD